MNNLENEGKPLSSERSDPLYLVFQNRNDYVSHQMTLQTIPDTELEWLRENSSTSIEYHLTAKIQNSSLTTRDLSLLLEVLNYQCIHYGLNLNMYLALSELYFRLLGNKTSSKEVSENKIRLTVTVSEVIMKCFRFAEFPLSADEFIYLPEKVQKHLARFTMTKRTYKSRYQHYRPERLFKISAVPVDIQFLKRRDNSEPYSGYCKGYGESHPSTHRQKLRPSAEYDGDTRSISELKDKRLEILMTDPVHLQCASLLIWFDNQEM